MKEPEGIASAGHTHIVAVRQYALRLVEDLGPLPGAGPSFRGQIGGNHILELETDEGVLGLAPGVEPDALARIRECLIGQPLFPIAGHVARLERGDRGLSGKNAASAEIALWDIAGRLLGQPLYRLWGGESGEVLAYCSTIGRGASIEERTDLAVRVHAEGWKAIKLRPHWETIGEDIRLVESVRAATSEDFMILCDANQARGRNLSGISWDMDRALVTGEAYQELGVGWLEEPLARTDLDGLAALNSRLDILLAGGENNVDLADFRHYAIRDCFGCWQPEVMLTGPGRFFKIAALAEAFGVTIIPHEGYQSLGTICQMHIAAALRSPYVEVLHNPPVSAYRNYVLPYLDAPVITDAGFVLLSEKPGLGVTLDRDLIEAEY